MRVYVGDAIETTRALGPEYDGIARGELAVRVAVVVITRCRNYCRVITNSDKLLVAPSPSLSRDSPFFIERQPAGPADEYGEIEYGGLPLEAAVFIRSISAPNPLVHQRFCTHGPRCNNWLGCAATTQALVAEPLWRGILMA